jgi:hydrogenase expression/formation protein HypC
MCLGIPGEIVEILPGPAGGNGDGDAAAGPVHLATVNVAGVRRAINIGLLGEEQVRVGDWVLVHVGFAMAKIDEAEAAATLAMLTGLGQAYTDELTALATSDIT